MEVPYTQGLSESFKTSEINMEYRYILKEEEPSITSWWLQGQRYHHTEEWGYLQIYVYEGKVRQRVK